MIEKDEIYQTLDKLPKEVLEEFVIYLKNLKEDPEKSIEISLELQAALEEEKEFFEKLAELLI